MTLTLSQKHFIKGTREFTLLDDEIQYTIKSPIKTESLSVVLSALDAKPVITGSTLEFLSKVNREPLVEFILDKPDKASFDQFIEVMKQRIVKEDFSRFQTREESVNVDIASLDESIDMLQKHVNPDEIATLLTALAELRTNPDDIKCQNNVAEAFNDLGFVQGQVITYAPYINYLLSENR